MLMIIALSWRQCQWVYLTGGQKVNYMTQHEIAEMYIWRLLPATTPLALTDNSSSMRGGGDQIYMLKSPGDLRSTVLLCSKPR